MKSAGERRRLPLPVAPRAVVIVPALVAGVLGTGLLYSGATLGSLRDLIIGAPLFGVGLWAVGWPFVLSTALVSERRRQRKIRGAG